jgi:hypothetical protein
MKLIDNVTKEKLIGAGLNTKVYEYTTCKICSGKALLFEIIDFNRMCLPVSYPLGLSGVPIYYHRCKTCGFLFTTAFDNFTSSGWIEYVYNDYYFKNMDTDYKVIRPTLNAEVLQFISKIIGYKDIVGVDYGGGNGVLSQILRKSNINYFSHDPFDYSDITNDQIGKFNMVSAFEVLEHTVDPIGTFEQIIKLAGDKFVFVASTQCSHNLIDVEKHLTWNYVSPRNGHVSIYTLESFKHIAKLFSLEYLPVSRGLHLFGKGRNLYPLKYASGMAKLKQRTVSKLF